MWRIGEMPECSVTVVVPLHNAGPWIEATLDSVAESTGVTSGEVEILVVDDGSTDDGPVLAERWLARWSGPGRLLTTGDRAPGGASAARNAGWQSARAPWIRFLDADDLVAPHALRLHLDAAVRHPCADVLHSAWAPLVAMVSNEGWQPGPTLDPETGPDPVSALLGSDVFIATGSALFRRHALERVGGFRESLVMVEDVGLLQDLALQGALFQHVPSPEPVLLYRQLPDSLSRRSEEQFALSCLQKAEIALSALESLDAWTPTRRASLQGAFFFCARALAPLNADAFERTLRGLQALHLPLIPSGPPALRALSRVTGYRRAEGLAVAYRSLKRRLLGRRPR